ncbi:MAG: DUF2079 domain-containing protein [Bacteroidales bacterium]|nr:DUF2079 domain-containing protein [Bacteroidales bacterium]
MNYQKINYFLFIILFVFTLIFSLISITNHYLFRTFALDLGMFNHALHSFSHFKCNYFTLSIDGSVVNYFGDHFSLIIILFAPFHYLFGSYTLLIIQIIFILLGGIGIYLYAKNIKQIESKIAYILLIYFFSVWGIYSALAFDFHTNVIAAMLLPWMVYFYDSKRFKLFLLVFILMLLCKENISLWLAFILISFLIFKKDRTIREKLKLEVPLIIFSFIYFVVISFYVMKYLNQGLGTIQTDKYIYLGSSLSEIITNIFTEPKYVFSLLFESPDTNPEYFGIKSEFYYMFLVSGGFLVLINPKYLIMIIPLIAQKMFSNSESMWGIKSHYSIEFVPIIILAVIDFIQKFSYYKQLFLVSVFSLITILATISSIDNSRALYYDKVNVAFYNSKHYKSDINFKDYEQFENEIPQNAILSVSSNLAPRLAFRDKIYHFPNIKDAAYVFVYKKSYYPFHSSDELNSCIMGLINCREFIKIKESTNFVLLKRVNYKYTFL